MLKLLLDIGNTATKAAIADGERLLCVARYDTFTEQEWLPLWKKYTPTVAFVASVRPDTQNETTLLQQYLEKVTVFDHHTPLPIRNLYVTPHTLGADRLAAAVGAHHLFPARDCLIIDCGTAITVDFLSSAGEFKGGNISPGLQMRFKALHNFTGQLPMGRLNEEAAPVGTTTQEAIEAGVLHGTVKEIAGYMAQYATFTPILTGGDAFFLVKQIKNPIFVVCNLNLIGLAKIAEYNVHL